MPRGNATLYVSLDALSGNWAAIRARVAPAQAAAVVKADAYGLGAHPAANALAQAGCRHFFVALLSEALPLASLLAPDCTVYVLNGLFPGDEAECADAGIVPVLNSLQQLRRWSELARSRAQQLPAILQIDTGMSRLGLSPDEVDHLVSQPALLEGVELKFVISHLACADAPDHRANEAQRQTFDRLARHFPGLPRALDNSGGALTDGVTHHDLVRPGIALYGGAPFDGRPNPMRPVVRLETGITQIRRVPAGTGVGYGHSFVTSRETLLATIPVGYADGWPRHLSNRGAAYIGGHRVPIIGRVSMDSITLDVTDVPAALLEAGPSVELIGPHQSLDDVARDAGTIAYEILTQLGARYERVYHGAEAAPHHPE